MKPSDEIRNPSLFSIQLVAGCIITMIFVYVAAGWGLIATGVIPKEGLGDLSPSAYTTLSLVFVAIGLPIIGASFPIKRALQTKISARNGTGPSNASAIAVAIAICEAPALFGFTLAMLGGITPYCWVLWSLSFAASILHFPLRMPERP
ncbi:MAG: hypothetical protein AMXMBFR84_36880 [Candidatus Hydrogenedentota bacterium]